MNKVMTMAPECDKTCPWCLSSDHWILMNAEDNRDDKTTTYFYECASVEDEVTCGNTTQITESNETEYDHEEHLAKKEGW